MYHPTKEKALAAGDALMEQDDRIAYVKAELEPFNGWRLVVVPRVYDIMEHAGVAEIRHPDGRTLSERPNDHKKPPRTAAKPRTRAAAPPPPPPPPPPRAPAVAVVTPTPLYTPDPAPAPPAPAVAMPPRTKMPWEV